MGLGVSKPVDELMRCWLIPTRGNHVSVSKGFDVLLSASGSVKKSPTRFSPIGLLENESPPPHRSFSRATGRTMMPK